MKLLIGILVLMLVLTQYRLWVGDGGLEEVKRLQNAVSQQKAANDTLQKRNKALEAEVVNLKQGFEAIEDRARSELGMIKEGETFIQVVEEPKAAPKAE